MGVCDFAPPQRSINCILRQIHGQAHGFLFKISA
jgi:hypothetical protein